MPKVEKEITIAAPVSKVYRAWHNFENFPKFMDNIEEVRVVGGNRSHWRAKGPLGKDAEWDAEMTLDEPDRTIGWRSIEGNSAVKTAGRVNFDRMDGQTKLRVTLQYESPAGAAGDVVTKIFANPEKQIEGDLQRFKQTVESDSSAFSYEPVMESGVAPGTGTSGGGSGSSREPLGGSMGPTTERDLENIERRGSGVQPSQTDDPGTRARTGEDFGHSKKDLPKL